MDSEQLSESIHREIANFDNKFGAHDKNFFSDKMQCLSIDCGRLANL